MKLLISILGILLVVCSTNPRLDSNEWNIQDYGRIQYKDFYIHKLGLVSPNEPHHILYFLEDEKANILSQPTLNYNVLVGKYLQNRTSSILSDPKILDMDTTSSYLLYLFLKDKYEKK
jgi:hypothetical protein